MKFQHYYLWNRGLESSNACDYSVYCLNLYVMNVGSYLHLKTSKAFNSKGCDVPKGQTHSC